MNVLMIEDELDFIEKIKLAAQKKLDITIFSPEEVELNSPFDEGEAIEDQLQIRLLKICSSNHIDIILLDTDLSRLRSGISQSACRQAFRELGIPVCRYSKRHRPTAITKLKDLARLAHEGASAIWVPQEILTDPENMLFVWLKTINDGFNRLSLSLKNDATLISGALGPAGILSDILEKPEIKTDLLGYTAQNLFFFAPSSSEIEASDAERSWGTRLGYWLANYILVFPGPILNEGAAAAYLNMTLSSFKGLAVQELIKPASYHGPFSELGSFFWREELGFILDSLDGDIATAPELLNCEIERVDATHPESSAFYCVLTHEPISAQDSSTTPDWIPVGAQLARIKQDIYDQLGPMLSI